MTDKFYTTDELRHELMTKLHDTAHDWATRPNLSELERCHGTVFGVLSVIEGVNGNGPDGKGLPLFQIIPSPNPEYNDARKASGLPMVSNNYPLDYREEQSGCPVELHREYATLYDNMKDELSRGAASLFS